jgi:hypothetical protein
MTNFSQIVREWETFYLLTGTAAATFIGLLFLAISIHMEVFHRKAFADMQRFATLTFNCYFYVFLISMLFLIPGVSPLGLGIPLLLLGSLALANAVVQRYRVRKSQLSRQGTDIASKFTVPILSLLGLAVVGVCVILQVMQSLYALVVVIVLLVASASVNAWSLLVLTDDQELVEALEHE